MLVQNILDGIGQNWALPS